MAVENHAPVFMPVQMLSEPMSLLPSVSPPPGAECSAWSGDRESSHRDRAAGWHLHPGRHGCGVGGAAPGHRGRAALILVPSAARVWLAVGHTDMRRGMNGLALQVQQALQRDPHAEDLFVFRGKRGDLAKILWHDGLGMSLYAKRLERGRFIWPTPTQGVVSISAAQLGYMLDGIDWRNPQHTWRPQAAG